MNILVPAIVIHGYEDAFTAATVAQRVDCPLILISAPGASAYTGIGWFKALIEQTSQSISRIEMIGILDCGRRAGDVLAALRIGIRLIRFTGHEDIFMRLEGCATQSGTVLLREIGVFLDPSRENDPVLACHDWLVRHKDRCVTVMRVMSELLQSNPQTSLNKGKK